MSKALLLVVLAAAIALRVWRHRRRRVTQAAPREHVRAGLGLFSGDVALVAAREVRERVRGRVFRVGTLLILAGVAAAIIIPTLHLGKAQPQRVGVVGALSAPLRATVVAAARSAGTTVRFVPEADSAVASSGLRSGHLDVVIVNGQELLLYKPLAPTDTSVTAEFARAASKDLGVAEAVAAAHLSVAQASVLARAGPLPLESLQRGTTKGATGTTSVIGLILVFVMLSQYNTWTLIGVMEEKSSRVIEVLLAAVRPVRQLTGKVLGIGLVAFAQASLIVVFSLAVAEGAGSDLLHGTAPVVLVSTLVWLVLGYAFYCWVYAAAGSMAERQDQVQSLAFPLSLPLIFGYVVSLTAASSASASLLVKVLAYLPPTAPFAMPVLVGLGAVTWWEFVASAAISIVCTVGMARLATAIYRRAVLRTGRRTRIRELFPRAATRSNRNPGSPAPSAGPAA